MKKILQFKMMRSLLLIVIAVMGFSSSGWAQISSTQTNVTIDDLIYTTTYDGSTYTAEITGVAENAVSKASLTIPAKATKKSVNYTYTVTSIDANAFKGCTSLKELYIETPTSKLTINSTAFDECTALEAIITQVGTTSAQIEFTGGFPSDNCYAYVDAGQISTFRTAWTGAKGSNIVSRFFDRGDWTFQVIGYQTAAMSALINTGEVTYTIPQTAINGTNQKSFNVTRIEPDAFLGATALQRLVIPSNIEYIDAQETGAFNAKLEYLKFDRAIPSINAPLVKTNSSIKSLTVNNLVKEYTDLATYGFTLANIPLADNSIITVGNKESDFAILLATAEANKGGGFIGTESKKITITTFADKVNKDKDTGIDVLDAYWWQRLSNGKLEMLYPACKVSELEGLVTIPEGKDISYIGQNCFAGYNKITGFKLNSDLTEIHAKAFATGGAVLTNMTIPGSVTQIDAPIFDTSIPTLLNVEAKTPPILPNHASSMSSASMTDKYLQVPYVSLNSYKTYGMTNAWGQYTVANITAKTFQSDDYIFSYNSVDSSSVAIVGLTTAGKAKQSFIIPEKIMNLPVTEVGEGAFNGTASEFTELFISFPSGLKKLYKPLTDGSTFIYPYFRGEKAPEYTGGDELTVLKHITVPKNATGYGATSFSGKTIYTAGSTDAIGYDANYMYLITGDATTQTASLAMPLDLTLSSYSIPSSSLTLDGTVCTLNELGSTAFKLCSSADFTKIDVPTNIVKLNGHSLAAPSLKKIYLKYTTTTGIPTGTNVNQPFVTGSDVTLYVEKGTKGMTGGYGTSGWAGIANEYIIENGAAGSRFTVGDYNYFVIADSTQEHGYHLQITSPVDSTKTYYSIPTTVMYNGSKYIVTSISDGNNADESFTKATKAITFILPDSIQSVFANAFSSSVKYIVLPKGLTTFESQPNLKNVKFYTEATAPADGWNIKANEITIPTGVSKAYTDKGFTKAYVLGDENSIYSEGGVWYQVYSATNTQAAAINPVDMGSKDLTIATKIIKDNFIVDKIAEKAFSNSALTSIKLGDSLKIIGDSAFWFTYITKISLPASVDSIGSSALRTSSTSGSTLALTDITVNNDTPCKWHAGDNYLPKNGVKLHVSSTTVKNAYMSKGWEGYTSTYESLIIPTKDETLVSDLVKGSDVTIVDGSNFHIGTSSVNYGYTSNTFAGYSPRNITIMDAVTTLTLSKDTVSGTVTVSNDKSDKIGLVLNIANSSFGNFTNNDTVQIAIDSQSKLGTITNNGVLVEESGVINKIDAGKTQMSVAGDINKSFPGNSSTKIFASATVLKGSAKADSVQFVWQLKDAKSVYQTIAKGTHYALAKKSGLRAAATKTLIDSLTVTEGGDYRCLITDFDSTKTAYATLGVYGTVTMSTPKTVGTITLKKFKKGYYEGVSYGKDTTFVFTKDTEFEFQIMDTFKTLITNYAVVTATYKSTGEKDTLKADGRYYYRILHTTDTITVSVDSCIITANEPISLTNNVKVWGNDGILHVSAPQRVTVYIATFDGRMRAVKSEAGDQEFYLGKGIYIIRIEDKTWKIKI